MKKLLLTLAFTSLAAAQQPPAPAPEEAKPSEAKPAEAKPAETNAADAASPVPVDEQWISGFIDLGYRWRTGVAGSFETYRSIVNLGSGPKLLGTEFVIRDKKRRVFDRMDVRAYNWGDDPYATLSVDALRENTYRLSIDYRNIAYFDNFPAFADPSLATKGFALNEQSYDTQRKIGNVLLEFRPGSWLVPYLAYGHNSSSGSGVTTFVSNLNEYPFQSGMTDSTESYRGGIRIEMPRFHATIEQGGTTFKNDQNTYVPPGGISYGSITAPVLGTTLDLTSLAQAYGIRGSSVYTKGLLSAHVTRWLDMTGQFLYSQPSTDTNYQQYNNGSFSSLNQLLFYDSEQYLAAAAAKMPHTTGTAGAEIRPLKRIRLVDTWMTDRLHNSASALQTDLLGTTPPQTIVNDPNAALLANYSQVDSQVFVDIFKGLVGHAGYRYVWGNADSLVLPQEGLVTHDRLRLQRNIVLGGLSYRLGTKYSVAGDFEAGTSASTYFPISLYDYQKFHIHANYNVTGTVTLSANLSWLKNTSPLPNENDYLSHAESLSLNWNPKESKHFSFLGTWEHSTLRSNIFYLVPQTLTPALSNYWESGNTFTGLIVATLPRVFGVTANFSGGGSFLLFSGSNATNYYQPIGKLTVPIAPHVQWNTEWRYYGFDETFYLYQSFRTHLVTTGVRVTR